MVHFRIRGQTPSKKSKQQIVRVKGSHRLIPNKKYNQWIKGAVSQLKEQKNTKDISTIDYPISVKCLIYRNTLRKIDKLNMEQSIHDALQEAEVIADDFLIESTDGSRRILGVPKGEERAEIFISSFSDE